MNYKLQQKYTHPHWHEALAFAFQLLIMAEPGDVICLLGPSRVGKSKLIEELMKLLRGQGDHEDFSRYTAISVIAANTGPNGTFSTKAFTKRLLHGVEHPSLTTLRDDTASTSRIDAKSESEMRDMLERAIELRGVKYLFIDEAQHIRYVSKNTQGAHAFLDSLKCLAASTGIVLVVVGAYPLLDIMQNSVHLLGRKRTVHFPRYSIGDKTQAKNFLGLAKNYFAAVKGGSKIDILSHRDYLFANTYGCIGLLKSWLISAAAYAEVHGTEVDMKILDKTAQSESDLEVIWKEIEDGEKVLRKIGHDSFINKQDPEKKPKKPENPKKGKSLKPFETAPKRHPVG